MPRLIPKPDPAESGCLGARAAGVDRRQRQQAAGLAGIARPISNHRHPRESRSTRGGINKQDCLP